MAVNPVTEAKKEAKRVFFEDLQDALLEQGYETVDGTELGMKGLVLVVKNIHTDKGVCDLKLTLSAPAKGVKYEAKEA